MKKILFTIFLFAAHHGFGQLTANIIVPPAGLMDKQQLWNIIVTNTEPGTLSIQLQVRFSEAGTGEAVFTASSGTLNVAPGVTQLSTNNLGPVFYNITNPNYRLDPGPTGLLPIGNFIVCYDFIINKYNKVVQECQEVIVPPLGPLLLTQPINGAKLEQGQPLFSWLPPSPTNLLNSLRYELKLVEMRQGQSNSDAVSDNIPLFVSGSLLSPTLSYSQNAPLLEAGKKYAWQIVAMNNQAPIAKSEAWSFSLQESAGRDSVLSKEPVYVKLSKEGSTDGSAIFWKNLRFDYFNETGDKAWKISVEDLTASSPVSFNLSLDSLQLKRGQNLISYNADKDERFLDKHQYVLKVFNSRNEVWRIRFEYRK